MTHKLRSQPVCRSLVSLLLASYIWLGCNYAVFGNDNERLSNITTENERLRIGRFLPYLLTERVVHHMEVDEQSPTDIIFTDASSLASTNGLTLILIAGSATQCGYRNGREDNARFGVITDFLQHKQSRIILVDRDNHCLRMLDRTTGAISDFLSACMEGIFHENRYYTLPYRIEKVGDDLAIVLFGSTRELMLLDLLQGVTLSLTASDTAYNQVFSNALQASESNTAYLLSTTHLLEINLIYQQYYATVLYRFDERFHLSGELISLGEGLFALANTEEGGIILLDINKPSEVFILCNSLPAHHLPGNCRLNRPISLLLSGDKLYIGTSNGIYVVRVYLDRKIIVKEERIHSLNKPENEVYQSYVIRTVVIVVAGLFAAFIWLVLLVFCCWTRLRDYKLKQRTRKQYKPVSNVSHMGLMGKSKNTDEYSTLLDTFTTQLFETKE